MIQRVQSVWLFLAGLTLFLLLILPILTKDDTNGQIWLQVGGIYQKNNNLFHKTSTNSLLFGATILTGLICLGNIFSFRNTSLQKRILLVSIILIFVLIAFIISYALQIPGGIESASYNVGAGLPFLSVLFCILAFKGIRKDEELIKSADRLR